MSELTYSEAAKQAIAEEMRRDPMVWALGEDLGRGGVFGQYGGLVSEFGTKRIVDTPISESTIMGVSVGAALVGTRPIVEMRFADFALCAIDEIVNQAAKARFMFGGQARVPIVVRQPSGMWRSSAAQHSQSLEAWYTHIPGLAVVAPYFPSDNKGLLKSAIRADDPVIFMEHKDLWSMSGDISEDDDYLVPLGKANVVITGSDVTIVTWSKQVGLAIAAVETAAKRGVSLEIVDLRTLWPWDQTKVFESVKKTGRLIVTHEAVQVSGFGAEIVATVAEQLMYDLKCPIRRLAAPRAPIGYSKPLEDELRVSSEVIALTALDMMSRKS